VSTLLLDTNIVSYQLRGHTLADAYRPLLAGNVLAISFITVGELLEGAQRANWGARRLAVLESTISAYLVLPYTVDICRSWADVRVARRNQPIASDDGWIAATAIAHNVPLVTHNAADFVGIPRLNVITLHGTP
jgi:tRNA(fMet)-specific endonuclease VapC